MPFCLLPSLVHRKSRRSLYSVVLVFSLGFLCILSTVAHLICVGVATSLPLFSALASLELGIALVVACCPSIKSGWDLRFYPQRQFGSPSRTVQCIIDGSPENELEHGASEQRKHQAEKEEKMYQESNTNVIQIQSVHKVTGDTQISKNSKRFIQRAKVEDDLGQVSLDAPDLASDYDQENDIGGLAPRERNVPATSSLRFKPGDRSENISSMTFVQKENLDTIQGERKLSSISQKLNLFSRHEGLVSGNAGGDRKITDEVGLSTFGAVESVL